MVVFSRICLDLDVVLLSVRQNCYVRLVFVDETYATYANLMSLDVINGPPATLVTPGPPATGGAQGPPPKQKVE